MIIQLLKLVLLSLLSLLSLLCLASRAHAAAPAAGPANGHTHLLALTRHAQQSGAFYSAAAFDTPGYSGNNESKSTGWVRLR